MFRPVSSKANFPQIEENILNLWKENDVFKRSIDRRQGAPRFVLYEGPPTANGSPGIHHVLSRVFKDVIPRYKAMKGYYTPRIAGWDTHGLPVELEVEKELGFSGKAQIEEYGVDRFNALCRQNVMRYIKEFEEMTERIAFWVDLENAYVTMKISYANMVGELCELLGADAHAVTQAIGLDSRIGRKYLSPGVAFGGPLPLRVGPERLVRPDAVHGPTLENPRHPLPAG